MAYSPKGTMNIYEIIIRWHAGYSLSNISQALAIDRKTVRRYIREAEACGFSKDEPLPEREVLFGKLSSLVHDIERETPARNQFEPFEEEIKDLITRGTDPLKPKTVYEVICHRYGVEASYSTFKRFIRKVAPELSGSTTTCRFETDPGHEIQLDYSKVGRNGRTPVRLIL